MQGYFWGGLSAQLRAYFPEKDSLKVWTPAAMSVLGDPSPHPHLIGPEQHLTHGASKQPIRSFLINDV